MSYPKNTTLKSLASIKLQVLSVIEYYGLSEPVLMIIKDI